MTASATRHIGCPQTTYAEGHQDRDPSPPSLLNIELALDAAITAATQRIHQCPQVPLQPLQVLLGALLRLRGAFLRLLHLDEQAHSLVQEGADGRDLPVVLTEVLFGKSKVFSIVSYRGPGVPPTG